MKESVKNKCEKKSVKKRNNERERKREKEGKICERMFAYELHE